MIHLKSMQNFRFKRFVLHASRARPKGDLTLFNQIFKLKKKIDLAGTEAWMFSLTILAFFTLIFSQQNLLNVEVFCILFKGT